MSKINADAVVPYKHAPAKKRSEASSMMAQSLPMAAMFMRNKMISWASFFLAIQSWLNEPINAAPVEGESTNQPPLLRIAFSLIGMLTCYMDLVFPKMASVRPTVKTE